MIPFMGTQSAVLGYQFGLGYESGKRTIKAMSNDDFNKFVIKGDKVEFEGDMQSLITIQAKKFWRDQVELFKDTMPEALKLMDTIIKTSVDIENKKAERTPSATAEIVSAFFKGVKKTGEQAGNGFTWQHLASLIFPFLFPASNIDNQPKVTPPGESEADKRRGGDPQSDKEPEPKDTGERFDKEEPPPKAPEPKELIVTLRYSYQVFGETRNVTVANTHSGHVRAIEHMEDVMNRPTTGSEQRAGLLSKIFNYRLAIKNWHGHWH